MTDQELIEFRLNMARAQGYMDAVKELEKVAIEPNSVDLILTFMRNKAITLAEEALHGKAALQS